MDTRTIELHVSKIEIELLLEYEFYFSLNRIHTKNRTEMV